MHGKGTLTTPVLTYTGFFAKGKREGQGLCEWKNGNKYDGNWRDDKRHGVGKYSCAAFQYLLPYFFFLFLLTTQDMTESGQMTRWKARVE